MPSTLTGGSYAMADDVTVTRVGYGAMQLAGPHVFGPPADRDAAIAVLREVVELGITHIDTSDFYGPVRDEPDHQRRRLHPYPADSLRIVTKVGSLRDAARWMAEGPGAGAVAPGRPRQPGPASAWTRSTSSTFGSAGSTVRPPSRSPHRSPSWRELQQEGLIEHLGLSTVNAEQIAEAQTIAPVVCVQNFYNIANREDDPLIDSLAAQGIAYVPYFPLGGFTPLQSDTLGTVAAELDATPMAVALAWLLQRSPNILLIPGTSSVEHLRENVAGAGLSLPADAIEELESIGG